MKKLSLIYICLLSAGVLTAACSKKSGDDSVSAVQQPPTLKGWTLQWNDEFNTGDVPSPDKWGYEVGGGGWGNNELEYYTQYRKENARVENGSLIIEARKEEYEGRHYTSARMVTTGKGDWLYGRIEVRAKLPSGYGTWPAIWMLPTDWVYGNHGWPDCGEIDIMEHVGYDQDVIHGTTHCQKYYFKNNTQRTATVRIPDVSTTFYTYAIEWYPDRIDFFVNDTKYFSSTNDGTGWEAWPFDKPFHLILNLAIGGDWGGVKGVDDSIFPQRMEVDYVRIYSKNQ
jgi:beta-glucanase (GH16 family)